MKKIEDEFVTYPLALRMKALGFAEPVMALFHYKDKSLILCNTEGNFGVHVDAPTWQSAFQWFMDNYSLFSSINTDCTMEPKFCYSIHHYDDKGSFEWECLVYNSPLEYTTHKAKIACLEKLLDISEQKQKVLKEEVQVVMVRTSRPANVGVWKVEKDNLLGEKVEGIEPGVLYFGGEKIKGAWKVGNIQCQHIHFLSDDKIEIGDWYFDLLTSNIHLANRDVTMKCFKKVIATTDESLGLPRPSNEFLEQFCELGGIDKVFVEYGIKSRIPFSPDAPNRDRDYVMFPKVTPDNTIKISLNHL